MISLHENSGVITGIKKLILYASISQNYDKIKLRQYYSADFLGICVVHEQAFGVTSR